MAEDGLARTCEYSWIVASMVPCSSSSSEDRARSQNFVDRPQEEQEKTCCKVHLAILGSVCALVFPPFSFALTRLCLCSDGRISLCFMTFAFCHVTVVPLFYCKLILLCFFI